MYGAICVEFLRPLQYMIATTQMSALQHPDRFV